MIEPISQLLRTFFTAIISLSLYHYFNWTEGYWLVIAAVLIVQVRNGNRFWQQFILVAGCGISAAITAFVASLLSGNLLLLSVFLFATCFLSVFIGWVFANIFIAAYLINLFGMLSSGLPAHFHDSVERFYLIIIGTLIALLANVLIRPRRLQRDTREMLAQCVMNIKNLQQLLFASYIAEDYQTKHYSYEKNIHAINQKILLDLQNVRALVKYTADNVFYQALRRTESLFELTLALGNLRYRVNDATTFGVVADELRALSEALTIIFDELANQILGKKIELSLSLLQERTERFEESYRTALQVVATDPVVFLFFIQQLKDIKAELQNLQKPEARRQDENVVSVSRDFFVAVKRHFSPTSMIFLRAVGVGFSVAIAVIISRLMQLPQEFLVSMSALMVMQTSFAHSLRQGLLRFLVLCIAVIVSSALIEYIRANILIDIFLVIILMLGAYGYQLQQTERVRLTLLLMTVLIVFVTLLVPDTSHHIIHDQIYNIILGSIVGLIVGVIFFPWRVALEFRKSTALILNVLANYFIAIVDLLLKKANAENNCQKNKYIVENVFQLFPAWVYEEGFNPELRVGYRHFLVRIEQLSQILFSMHYLVGSSRVDLQACKLEYSIVSPK